MSSLTAWARIEPHARDDSLSSADARVFDPLWLLGRQWQVGEFAGEDAGSPVHAYAVVHHAPISRFGAGRPESGTSGASYDPAALPLDRLVEREPARPPESLDLRFGVEAGLVFLRLLDAAKLGTLRGAWIAAHVVAPVAGAEGLAAVMAGRALDGRRLAAALGRARTAGQKLPDDPPVDPQDEIAIIRVLGDWLAWWATRVEPLNAPGCWDEERLEYAFAAGARTNTGGVGLIAAEYDGSGVDWHCFDLDPGTDLGATADAPPTREEHDAMPVPAAFPGMPVARWWEFEDAAVRFGAVEAGPEDVARLLLMEFALVYGNDWWVIPLELPAGTVCEVESLEVTDTFGFRWSIPAAAEIDGDDFALFRCSTRAGASRTPPASLLVLAPGAGPALEGEPSEELRLLRDEQANLAWAVEWVVEGIDGRRVRRQEAWHRRRGLMDAATEAAGTHPVPSVATPLTYRLAVRPPDFWLPFVPVAHPTGAQRLELRTLLDDASPPRAIEPAGRLIHPGQVLFDEEVPREGRGLTRSHVLARWHGGVRLLWERRRGGPGRGPGSSGLRFDAVEPPP